MFLTLEVHVMRLSVEEICGAVRRRKQQQTIVFAHHECFLWHEGEGAATHTTLHYFIPGEWKHTHTDSVFGFCAGYCRCRWARCHDLNQWNGFWQYDECLAVTRVIEFQQLTAAFDPLTAHTHRVKMALIICVSRADLLEAAFSPRHLAVYHTHSPQCHTAQTRCRDTQKNTSFTSSDIYERLMWVWLTSTCLVDAVNDYRRSEIIVLEAIKLYPWTTDVHPNTLKNIFHCSTSVLYLCPGQNTASQWPSFNHC